MKKLPKKVRTALLDGLGATKIRVDYHTVDGRDTHWLTTYAGVRWICSRKYGETANEKLRAPP